MLNAIWRRLGLERPEPRAWALYDWANSAFMTVIVTAVFPVYFNTVAAEGLDPKQAAAWFGGATTLSLLAVALCAPLLGPIADFRAIRKRLLGLFVALGTSATAALAWVGPGDARLGAVLFAIATVGATGSFVFYDALLPHVARGKDLDQLSTTAYALGYLGGGLLLAFDLALILAPGAFGLPTGEGLSPQERTLPTRLAFLSVSLWWGLFSLPLFLRVPEPARTLESDEQADDRPLVTALSRLRETFTELGRYRHALWMLAAFLLYNDGIGTIIKMSTFFGSQLGFDSTELIKAVLVVQFVGVPAAVAFGRLAAAVGPKRALLSGVAAYVLITLFAFRMRDEGDFMLLAVAVGLVMGGTQALSRSLFASMIPQHKATEFFALFGVLEKFAGLLGPALFTAVAATVDEPRVAILVILPMFVIGGALLMKVDVEAGRRVAREMEREVRLAEH